MGKKILLLLGDFTEGLEAYFAFQALRMIGHEVDAVCPGKKKGEVIATAVHDFDGFQTYSEKRGHNFPINKDFDSVNPSDYDGIYIPGGRGAEYIRLDQRVLDIVKHFIDAKKPIASLCHGPQVLITAGGVKGRKLTCYRAVKPELEASGGIFVDIPNSEATVDGNLVTGVDWWGQGEVVKKFAELLGSKIVA
mmetsp:Transcript_5362/g.7535  ORF Transcript_5362/g.7535 Transcript_5362/m.7535 type:complete len:193 (-) Transcript_5362:2113-2691(-)|eukprot:CAMPEP_0168545330 /NCGR_PEP_ID=MMETSP0413-20121227/2904_1 /TAXON_ID=136452 /ORGANISM="Filamoeba nolandi, Strain NC-AS-23-1" /LENGTH=192 /DNA_ID=CAMNT_0008575427 /DNA_START=59 /DNA_END=637 /DNA_ORIENTATION=+